MMKVLNFEAHPDTNLCVVLYDNVKNAADLKSKLLSRALPLECALINAAVVPDVRVLHAAAAKALAAHTRNALTSRNLHSELIYDLSSTKHIAESLKRFGVADDSTKLLVACFNAQQDQLEQLCGMVQGESVPLDKLSDFAVGDIIDKYYKITPEELRIGSRADAIVCRIAARELL